MKRNTALSILLTVLGLLLSVLCAARQSESERPLRIRYPALFPYGWLTTHSQNEFPIAWRDDHMILFSAAILLSADSRQFPGGTQRYAASPLAEGVLHCFPVCVWKGVENLSVWEYTILRQEWPGCYRDAQLEAAVFYIMLTST